MPIKDYVTTTIKINPEDIQRARDGAHELDPEKAKALRRYCEETGITPEEYFRRYVNPTHKVLTGWSEADWRRFHAVNRAAAKALHDAGPKGDGVIYYIMNSAPGYLNHEQSDLLRRCYGYDAVVGSEVDLRQFHSLSLIASPVEQGPGTWIARLTPIGRAAAKALHDAGPKGDGVTDDREALGTPARPWSSPTGRRILQAILDDDSSHVYGPPPTEKGLKLNDLLRKRPNDSLSGEPIPDATPEASDHPTTCSRCNGTGDDGLFAASRCSACSGRGTTPTSRGRSPSFGANEYVPGGRLNPSPIDELRARPDWFPFYASFEGPEFNPEFVDCGRDYYLIRHHKTPSLIGVTETEPGYLPAGRYYQLTRTIATGSGYIWKRRDLIDSRRDMNP